MNETFILKQILSMLHTDQIFKNIFSDYFYVILNQDFQLIDSFDNALFFI